MGVKAKSKVHVRPPQVFINFRGDELRENFVNQLVRAPALMNPRLRFIIWIFFYFSFDLKK